MEIWLWNAIFVVIFVVRLWIQEIKQMKKEHWRNHTYYHIFTWIDFHFDVDLIFHLKVIIHSLLFSCNNFNIYSRYFLFIEWRKKSIQILEVSPRKTSNEQNLYFPFLHIAFTFSNKPSGEGQY